ncbi:methyltransferase domain-containing protein [Erythrobacter arachoides]|uniref:Methyltransferase domain-containing protein n=1 Tax=Aurantiacibacter arachoides TaxID=1850444 RepID=A0A844ZYR8_9SPHN|nr:class I SAM-dependent methyltransferase [Aurantiacibacter arachoides]MXO93431.1 methyltransferase domain-containing protein [Aurantiacibacter arachoides]GGD49458.1 hypothetical protein GCM10011411_06510 [Aurantiacibacter arachoides]
MSDGDGDRAAWEAFWRENGTAQWRVGSCLPAAQALAHMEAQVWSAFAKTLPAKARVLDLGTGDGRAMAALLRARRDLKPIGIDMAGTLPPPPRGAKMLPGVMMHELPFPPAHFAGVISQFGFEYGDIHATAAAIARVLQPGGRIGLIVHREDSPIIAHNRERAGQIRWALEDQGLADKALRNLQLRASGILALPSDIAEAPERAVSLFGPQSAGWEIAEAICRTLLSSRHEMPAQTAAIVRQIVAKAKAELGRIGSLERAAQASGLGEKIAAAIVATGMIAEVTGALDDGKAATPLATCLTFRKPR